MRPPPSPPPPPRRCCRKHIIWENIAQILIAFAWNNIMVKWLAMANILFWGGTNKSAKRYTPNKMNIGLAENPITPHVYRERVYARTHTAGMHNGFKAPDSIPTWIYDYFMMIIFETKIALIFASFHSHAHKRRLSERGPFSISRILSPIAFELENSTHTQILFI